MSRAAAHNLFPEAGAGEGPAASPAGNGAGPGNGVLCGDAFLARLARMSSRQRIEASRSGAFTRHERAVWACHYPEEVPRVNGEFEWIALRLADND